MNGKDMENFTEAEYNRLIENIFQRFPSFQKYGSAGYHPGLDNMKAFDDALGNPHGKYATIHVAGTNGKGSVSSMIASALSAMGYKTGLYTSPHLKDFRERAKICEGDGYRMIPKERVYEFCSRWGGTMDRLGLSFFEITTAMAFDWFSAENVDIAVIETGLGGRLDSTNIISPVLSVITGIGLDHCDILGHTLSEIAFEKAGIIKPETDAVIWKRDEATAGVFVKQAEECGLMTTAKKHDADEKDAERPTEDEDRPMKDEDSPMKDADRPTKDEDRPMKDEDRPMKRLYFADMDFNGPQFRMEDGMMTGIDEMVERIYPRLDLQGEYQRTNLRTVLAALQVVKSNLPQRGRHSFDLKTLADALRNTAKRTGLRGRWDKVRENPLTITDIGHNADGLEQNFRQLNEMTEKDGYSLIMVYGTMADKDYVSVMRMMPEKARVIFTNASSRRALPAAEVAKAAGTLGIRAEAVCQSVDEAVGRAMELADSLSANGEKPMIYIGGSAFIVAEAMETFDSNR